MNVAYSMVFRVAACAIILVSQIFALGGELDFSSLAVILIASSIARAMLKNAPVVLLDEATASVDPENEVYLQQAISTLVKDKTLIVIAHRLSTIRDAEQILVIDNGKLVQHGKHDELVLQEGIYQKYWNIRQNAKAWKVAQ